MLFNSINFIVFALIFFPIYHLATGKVRLFITLISSYIFYSFFDYRFLLLILGITLINYYFGLLFDRNRKKIYLLLALALNLLTLAYFKYFNFFIDSFYDLLQIFGVYKKQYIFEIILPVGISFFTFQGMSYTIDVYKKKIKAEKSLLKFSTYISLFPQLVAGPIVRAGKIMNFLGEKSYLSFVIFLKSMELIIYGYFLKVCVADRLGIITEQTFSAPENYGGFTHLISSTFFSFQIYADFAGYSLIAIGLGKLMCLRFGTNFCRPYYASNIQDFWRRWHISLSSWLRDYVYIPLGGNRVNTPKIFVNIVIVMFLGGLWHGASYNFVIWGTLHGILLCLFRIYSTYYKSPHFPKSFNILLTFLLVNFLWIFFRSDNLDISLMIIEKIFSFNDYFLNISFDLFNLIIGFFMIVLIIFIDFYFEYLSKKFKYRVSLRIFFSIIILWMIIFLGVFEGTNFIYFKF